MRVVVLRPVLIFCVAILVIRLPAFVSYVVRLCILALQVLHDVWQVLHVILDQSF